MAQDTPPNVSACPRCGSTNVSLESLESCEQDARPERGQTRSAESLAHNVCTDCGEDWLVAHWTREPPPPVSTEAPPCPDCGVPVGECKVTDSPEAAMLEWICPGCRREWVILKKRGTHSVCPRCACTDIAIVESDVVTTPSGESWMQWALLCLGCEHQWTPKTPTGQGPTEP